MGAFIYTAYSPGFLQEHANKRKGTICMACILFSFSCAHQKTQRPIMGYERSDCDSTPDTHWQMENHIRWQTGNRVTETRCCAGNATNFLTNDCQRSLKSLSSCADRFDDPVSLLIRHYRMSILNPNRKYMWFKANSLNNTATRLFLSLSFLLMIRGSIECRSSC